MSLQPVIKWSGSKRSQAKEIISYMPSQIEIRQIGESNAYNIDWTKKIKVDDLQKFCNKVNESANRQQDLLQVDTDICRCIPAQLNGRIYILVQKELTSNEISLTNQISYAIIKKTDWGDNYEEIY